MAGFLGMPFTTDGIVAALVFFNPFNRDISLPALIFDSSVLIMLAWVAFWSFRDRKDLNRSGLPDTLLTFSVVAMAIVCAGWLWWSLWRPPTGDTVYWQGNHVATYTFDAPAPEVPAVMYLSFLAALGAVTLTLAALVYNDIRRYRASGADQFDIEELSAEAKAEWALRDPDGYYASERERHRRQVEKQMRSR